MKQSRASLYAIGNYLLYGEHDTWRLNLCCEEARASKALESESKMASTANLVSSVPDLLPFEHLINSQET